MRRCVSEEARQETTSQGANAGAGAIPPRQPEASGALASGGIRMKESRSKPSRLGSSLHYRLPIEARLLLVSMSIVFLASLAALELRFF